MEATTELLGVLKQRQTTYAFLSQVYREEFSLENLKAFRDASPCLGGSFDAFSDQIAEADLEQTHIDLAADYAALFLGMSPNPVAPYESVYVSGEELLMQDARDEVLALYRDEDLVKTSHFNLPEDHIAVELAYMNALCRYTYEAYDAGDRDAVCSYEEKQAHFVLEHLAKWVPQFCVDVKGSAKTDFYKGLAEITEFFLAMEIRSLQDSPHAAV